MYRIIFDFYVFLHGFVSPSFSARRLERDHQREGLRAGGRGVARAEPRPRRRSSSRDSIHAGRSVEHPDVQSLGISVLVSSSLFLFLSQFLL